MRIDSASSIVETPVGPLYARADAGALTMLSFVDGDPRDLTLGGAHGPSRIIVDAVEVQLREYFAGRRTAFDVPMNLKGAPFQQRVWQALLAIPYGVTATYGQVAKHVGEPDGARAVGVANASNPIVIIVPCHRVIGINGRLVGYGGGLHRKRILLDLEIGRAALNLASHF